MPSIAVTLTTDQEHKLEIDLFDTFNGEDIIKAADMLAEKLAIEIGELPLTQDDDGKPIVNPKYVEKYGEPKFDKKGNLIK